jgi:hypothetical protein
MLPASTTAGWQSLADDGEDGVGVRPKSEKASLVSILAFFLHIYSLE